MPPKPKDDKFNIIESSFKILEGYSKSLAKAFSDAFNPSTIERQLLDLDDTASELAKQFGVGRQNIENINKAIGESITDVILLGGKWDDVYKTQKAVSSDLGRNVLLSNESVKTLFATSQVTGIETGKLAGNFKDMGVSASMVGKEMETVVGAARSIGVSAQAVSSMAVDNLKRMNEFNFQGGVEGLAKMAAQAVNLRVDMKQTLSLAEKLFEPERAIEMAAAMQRLGVAQGDLLDPLRLMDLAQNDPTELQNQIAQMTKQFVFMNEQGKFELFKEGKLRLREIAKELNIPYDTLTNMALSGAELEDKLGKIKFPTGAFTEEQQKFIANVAEMNDKGEYEFKINGKVYGLEEGVNKLAESATSNTEEGQKLFKQFMTDQEPKSMEDLAKDQLSVLKNIESLMDSIKTVGFGLGSSKLGADILNMANATSKTAIESAKSVNPLGKTTEQQSQTFDKIYETIMPKSSDDFTLKEMFDDSVEIMELFKSNIKTNVIGVFEELNETIDELKEDKNIFYEIFKGAKDMISGVKEELKIASNDNTNTKQPSENYEDLKIAFEKPKIDEIKEKDVSNLTIEKYEPTEIAFKNTPNQKTETPTSEVNVNVKHEFSNLPPNIDETEIANIISKSINNQEMIQSIIQNIKMEQGAYGIGQQNMQPENSRFGYS